MAGHNLRFVIAVLLLGWFQPGLGQTYDGKVKVIIIGAGAAGLQAAKDLHDQGMDDLLIPEAASYYGGRVHDVTFAGVQVEAGANWAQPPGTEIIDTVNETGHDVSVEAEPIWEEIEHALDKMGELGVEYNDECRKDISVRAALRLAGWRPRTPIHKVVEIFDFDFEWADIPEVTSLKASTATQTISAAEPILFVTDQGGFKRIFEEITPWLMTDTYKNHLRLNQTVVSIADKPGEGVEVACSDGTKYTGDYVIVTVSLGVLQNDGIAFGPPLPDWKIEKFYQFNMASFAKIFLKFPTKFWDDEEWILYASGRRGYYPVFTKLNAPGLFPPDTNIFVGFVTGDEARRIQKQPLSQTKAEIGEVLRNMYPTATVSEASDIYVTDWETNPLFHGSFSNWPVEVSREGFKQIQSRVGNIFFAGEHTDPMYNGYIIGGMRSGAREVRKILGCMAGKECPVYRRTAQVLHV